MSLIPAFRLGLLNAWILILPIIIFSIVGTKILGKREPGQWTSLSNIEKIAMSIVFIMYAYSVFLPLKLNTVWFYTGLIIYLIGLAVDTTALHNFATTPLGKPVTKGVYRISRNPMYVGEFLTNIGISTACLSWIFLLYAIVMITLEHNTVTAEEKICLKQYGDAYKEYLKTTPRWIGIPKPRKND